MEHPALDYLSKKYTNNASKILDKQIMSTIPEEIKNKSYQYNSWSELPSDKYKNEWNIPTDYPETEEHFSINSQTKEVFKLRTENARLKGEYTGFCKAMLWWNIPEELKSKIQEQIKLLEE